MLLPLPRYDVASKNSSSCTLNSNAPLFLPDTVMMCTYKPEIGSSPSSLVGAPFNCNRNILTQNLFSMPHNSSDVSSTNSGAAIYIPKDGQQKNKDSLRRVVKLALSSVVVTATAPFNRVYILMQCQNHMLKTGRLSTPYKGMEDCFLRTIKHEGFYSLWRGNSVRLFTSAAFQAMVNVPPKDVDTDRHRSQVPYELLPAAVLLVNSIYYPLEYANVRLVNDIKTKNAGNRHIRQFSGALDVAMKTLKSDGFGGFYRGFTSYSIGFTASACAVIATKEYFTTYTKEKQNQKLHKMLGTVGLEFMTLVCVPLVVYPFGTVGKRMMMTSCEFPKYKGPFDAVSQILRKEGVGSLFKGATPLVIANVARASMATMLLYTLPLSVFALSSKDLRGLC